ncbi:hypothetical protein [Pseudoduganella chitinolytica]|uniref:Uncharacterized protein n=1 Tax=Pseudoduganella chitinolytica TaxID=34070 RepID=A0ABY8BIS7_9BURK|nr:hypothetical protein [Pseudoduganella chitinolytica]WEF34858.1 hypothetical protein PX653_08880 [Pseudoduganella chitinolytica]
MLVKVRNAGAAGVIKDLSKHELPLGAWTDASNVRFLDGYCQPFLGHGSVFGAPAVTPYHTLPVAANGKRYWLYASSDKVYAVSLSGGDPAHLDLTPQDTTLGLKYAAQPMFGALGLNAGTSTNIGTHQPAQAFGGTAYSSLQAGLQESAMSSHVAAPSFSRSALQAGVMPANAPTQAATLTVGLVTTDRPLNMQPNQITSTLLSGIPIINPGNLTDPPQRWNLDEESRFETLDNWPDDTFCQSLRSYKGYLVALNITKNGQNYPFMVKWSSPAEPGAVPSTWDIADRTQDAGEYDLAESNGRIVDGLQLRDSFMIYKEDSVWRMDYTGGDYVFRFTKVLGVSGALNRNCIADIDGAHIVLTGSDVILHDGQQGASILDKRARRALFQDFDVSATDRAFIVKNPFLNEVFICYASVGYSVPNRALVYNYVDKTVTYRDMPSVHHANYGPLDAGLGDTWDSDSDPWESDLTLWNGPDFTPNSARVLMASDAQKLLLLDSSATYDGEKPSSYLERVGLSFDLPERIKLVRGVRARITGNVGSTVLIRVGASDDPYADPEYDEPIEHVIGETVSADCMVSGRYIALRIESGTAYFYRLDSFDVDVVDVGAY